MAIKGMIKGFILLFGYELRPLPTSEQREQILVRERKKTLWLRNMKIKTVLDIGANTGQFAAGIRKIFPEAMLYSFEPLPDCYNELIENFKKEPKFQAFNVALGNETGFKEILRNEYSPSSSFRSMAELHKQSYPYTSKETVERVEMCRLDDVARDLKVEKPVLIKLDVQGFEDKVIEGGAQVIQQADIVIIEMSIEMLYIDQPLFDVIYQRLKSFGFRYHGNYDQLCNPIDGRILQVDGIFIRSCIPLTLTESRGK